MSDVETSPAVTRAEQAGAPALHLGLAEQGKLYALTHEHELALAYYRQAIRMCVQAGDPEIFFRHYLECVLESLERMGAYAEVLDYCDKAIDLLATSEQPRELAPAELAHVYQRQGVIHLKSGNREAATQSLRKAVALAVDNGLCLPLSRTLIGWLDRGLQVDVRRIENEQQRTRYYSVREETVDKGRAVKLPNEQLILGAAAR